MRLSREHIETLQFFETCDAIVAISLYDVLSNFNKLTNADMRWWGTYCRVIYLYINQIYTFSEIQKVELYKQASARYNEVLESAKDRFSDEEWQVAQKSELKVKF